MDESHNETLFFNSDSAFKEHMVSCHEDAFSEDELDGIADASYLRVPVDSVINVCPFCPIGPQVNVPTEKIITHVAEHLLSFAQISLSWLMEGEASDAQSSHAWSSQDQPEDEYPGFLSQNLRPTFVRAFSNDCLDDAIESEINQSCTGPELPATNGTDDGGEGQQRRRFIVAVDFGTTFSAVAYTVLRPGEDRTFVDIHQISCISGYDDASESVRGLTMEVPTETCYPLSVRPTEASSGEMMDLDALIDTEQIFRWGFSVHEHFKLPDADRSSFQRITRSKLLLAKSDYTRELREQLRVTAKKLEALGIIKDSMDLIVDFLTHLLAHTKAQLILSHDFNDNDSVEWVLCVPVAWRRRAVRKMQDALTEASHRALFGRTISNSVENLYIVSEPEAAAAHVLASTREVKVASTRYNCRYARRLSNAQCTRTIGRRHFHDS
jgi:hypothetical protein